MAGKAFLAVLLWAARAGAQGVPSAVPIEGPAVPHPVIEEHKLMPVDESAPRPAVDEQVHALPEWAWPREHLEKGGAFADPFIGPEVYPEISAGVEVTAARIQSNRAVVYDDEIALSMYLLEIKFPLIAYNDGSIPATRVLFDLKIPLALSDQHRLAFVWGASIPANGPLFSQSSRGELLYAFGGYGLTVQLKLGYGYEQLFLDQPLRLAGLYGGLVSLRLGRFQPVVQVDGARTTNTRANRVALTPGLWIFPFARDTVQLGISALIVLSSDQNSPGDRYGALARLSYNFL